MKISSVEAAELLGYAETLCDAVAYSDESCEGCPIWKNMTEEERECGGCNFSRFAHEVHLKIIAEEPKENG